MADGSLPPAPDARRYLGIELDLFASAHRWRRYWTGKVRHAVGRRVLEVGAGIGSTTLALWHPRVEHWQAVEPDGLLAERFAGRVAALSPRPALHRGTLESLPPTDSFDTLVYVDVLEHLEDDAGELARAMPRLRPGGRLIVLSPAHGWLFSPFDAAIGHYRRYSARGLRRLLSPHVEIERLLLLDSLGIALSLSNRLLLGRREPTRRQVAFWNGVVVPLSRLADPLIGRSLGRSVLAIGRKPGG